MRFHYQSPEVRELAYFKLAPTDRLLTYTQDVWPGYPAPVYLNNPSYGWEVGVFGLVPPWLDPTLAKSTMLAPVEKAGATLMYQNAWQKRQLCVIPVSCLFVRSAATGRPVPWRIERHDHRPFYVAGLWELRPCDQSSTHWSFAMLTRNANDLPFMNRFSSCDEEKSTLLVVPKEKCEQWLESRTEEEILSQMRVIDSDVFAAYAIDSIYS